MVCIGIDSWSIASTTRVWGGWKSSMHFLSSFIPNVTREAGRLGGGRWSCDEGVLSFGVRELGN